MNKIIDNNALATYNRKLQEKLNTKFANKNNIPIVPTKLSELNNDLGFTTADIIKCYEFSRNRFNNSLYFSNYKELIGRFKQNLSTLVFLNGDGKKLGLLNYTLSSTQLILYFLDQYTTNGNDEAFMLYTATIDYTESSGTYTISSASVTTKAVNINTLINSKYNKLLARIEALESQVA